MKLGNRLFIKCRKGIIGYNDWFGLNICWDREYNGICSHYWGFSVGFIRKDGAPNTYTYKWGWSKLYKVDKPQ